MTVRTSVPIADAAAERLRAPGHAFVADVAAGEARSSGFLEAVLLRAIQAGMEWGLRRLRWPLGLRTLLRRLVAVMAEVEVTALRAPVSPHARHKTALLAATIALPQPRRRDKLEWVLVQRGCLACRRRARGGGRLWRGRRL